jgi:tetratricopeptide (TPR) repeat protein
VTGADFFVSYTQADRGWAEWIAWQLEAAGYTTQLQAWDFIPGSDWAHQMQQGTMAARRTIAVLSSAYLKSDYGEAEWRVAFANDPTGEKGLLVPVRVEPVQPPGLLQTIVYVDLVGLSRQAASARLLESISHARGKPVNEPPFPGAQLKQAVAGQEPRFPALRPEITNLPARNRNFTGRAELLERLQAGLRAASGDVSPQAMVIHGLGGVGKSQLVLEYAHWHAAEYELIWWIPAQRTTTAVAALAALARRLGGQEDTEQGELMAELFAELRRRTRWLLIFNNADTPKQLAPLLPPGGDGHVLVTSRDPAWAKVAEPLRLDVLRRVESVALLRRRTGSDDEASAVAVAEFLGDLPLALEEAAAYIEETRIDLVEYLRLARERTAELFGLDQPSGDEQRVATTWSVSLDSIRLEAPAAEELLDLCAFLAPDDIPRELPRHDPGQLPSPLAQAARDPLAYHDAVRVLGRYSLATVTPSALGVHLLVQVVVRARLGLEGERRWGEVAVRLLQQTFPDRSSEAAAWPACQRLLPHVLVTAEHAKRLKVGREEAGWLLDRTSAYLRGRGQALQALRTAERALAITREALGPNHPVLGERHYTLGRILLDLGDLDGARAELERALAIVDMAVDADHPSAAIIRSNLQRVLRELKDPADPGG